MYVRVKVSAGAKKEFLEVISEDAFVASVKEPASRNLANRRVAEMIKKHFGEKSLVRLVSGHRSPSKIFSVENAKGALI